MEDSPKLWDLYWNKWVENNDRKDEVSWNGKWKTKRFNKKIFKTSKFLIYAQLFIGSFKACSVFLLSISEGYQRRLTWKPGQLQWKISVFNGFRRIFRQFSGNYEAFFSPTSLLSVSCIVTIQVFFNLKRLNNYLEPKQSTFGADWRHFRRR